MSHLKLILSLVFAGVVVVFVVQNVAMVEIGFLFWSFTLPRSLLIFSVLAIGIVIGWMLGSWFSCRRQQTGDETE